MSSVMPVLSRHVPNKNVLIPLPVVSTLARMLRTIGFVVPVALSGVGKAERNDFENRLDDMTPTGTKKMPGTNLTIIIIAITIAKDLG